MSILSLFFKLYQVLSIFILSNNDTAFILQIYHNDRFSIVEPTLHSCHKPYLIKCLSLISCSSPIFSAQLPIWIYENEWINGNLFGSGVSEKLVCVLTLPFQVSTLSWVPLLYSFWLFQAGSFAWVTMASGLQKEVEVSLLSAYADVISNLLVEWNRIIQLYMAQKAIRFRIPLYAFWFLGSGYLHNGWSGE